MTLIEACFIFKIRTLILSKLCVFVFSIKSKSAAKRSTEKKKSIPYKILESFYAPVLFQFPVRVLVLLIFFAWFCVSIAVAPRISVGLEQELSMPDDSHVLKYFQAMFDYLSIGPPVYFVVKDSELDYSDPQTQEYLRAGNFPYSLASQVFSASKQSHRTNIARPAASWIDDYIDWANADHCCKINNKTGEFCPSSSKSL